MQRSNFRDRRNSRDQTTRRSSYPVLANVPSSSLGYRDYLAIRDMIGMAAGERTEARVRINLDVKMEPNLKTGTVWGTLPGNGNSDGKVYVLAHRDGWFEGANDNGAGVATMLGIAEYFSKVPEGQRRRGFLSGPLVLRRTVRPCATVSSRLPGTWVAQPSWWISPPKLLMPWASRRISVLTPLPLGEVARFLLARSDCRFRRCELALALRLTKSGRHDIGGWPCGCYTS